MTTATIERDMQRTGKELILKNAHNDPISMDQLKRFCPSVFATSAHEDVSSRYGFASTATILQALEKEGFVPVEARSYMRRDPDRVPYTKHLLRLRKAGSANKLLVAGEVIPQVVLLNSHDRSSLLKMYAGMFRVICANGLIVSTKDAIEPVVVRHTNRIVDEVMSNIHRLAADAGRVVGIIERMQDVKLTARQQVTFAREAAALRNGGGEGLDHESLLVPRRKEDASPSLWHVYNRVQENMIKGGITRVTATGRQTTTKEVVSINPDVDINAGLWELAMAAINKAKAK